MLSNKTWNPAATEWSHEKLFPGFHLDENDYYYEDYEEDRENWKWKEFRSIILGPCYMFEFAKNLSTGDEGPEAMINIQYGREKC